MNDSFKPNPNYPYKTDEINFKVDQIKPMKLEEPDSTIKMEFDADANFQLNIQRAIDAKLKSNIAMCKILCTSNLPLCHYYEYGGKRVDAGYEWIIDHIEARRVMLRTYFKEKAPLE